MLIFTVLLILSIARRKALPVDSPVHANASGIEVLGAALYPKVQKRVVIS